MKDLNRWLDREAERARRRPLLEESLLAGAFARYVLHRLRFVSLGQLVGYAVHVVEFTFLVRVFSAGNLGLSFGVHNGAFLLAGFWWGALELMRVRLRELRPGQETSNEVSRWLGLATSLAIGVVGLSALAAAGAWIGGGRAPGVLHVYLLVVLLRLALDLVVRTVYSGVYARRRVYRPVGAILLVETAGLVTIVALWKWLGAWSFPLSLGLSLAVSRGVVLRYSLRAYDSMHVPRPRLRLGLRPVLARAEVGTLITAGLAQASTRIGSLMVLLLLLRERGTADGLVRTLHLVAPLLATAGSWSQVFYLDFKRLQDECAGALRRRLQRGLNRTSVVVGLVLFGVAAAVLTGSGGGTGSAWIWLPLLPLFVLQSMLGVLQLRLFALGHFVRVVRGFVGLGLGVGLGIPASLLLRDVPAMVSLPLLVSAAMVISILLLRGRPGSSCLTPGGHRESVFSWLGALARTPGPVRVGSFTAPLALGPQRRAILDRVTERLGSDGAVTSWRGRVLWFEGGEAPLIDREHLVIAGAGLVDQAVITPRHASGRAALGAKVVTELLGAPAAGSHPPDSTDLAPEFRRRFPTGIVVDVLDAGDATLAGLERQTRQEIWRAARVDARGARTRPRSGYDVTAFVAEGEIRLLFAVPRELRPKSRAAWRSTVLEANWLRSLAPEGRVVPRPSGPMDQVPWRSLASCPAAME